MAIEDDIQQLDIGKIVTLFVVDTRPIGGTDILRFTPSVNFDQSALVRFDGNDYSPIPCEATGFEYNGRGPIPTPTLTISNALGFLSAAVIEFSDLIGAVVQRIRVFDKYIGNVPNPESLPIDHFTIEQKTAQNKVFVEFQLSSILDQEGVKIPRRQILRSCTHTYRIFRNGAFDYDGVSCPYRGNASFDNQDNPSSATDDVCSKRVNGCQVRFGQNAQLPLRAFPSVARVR